MYCMVFGGSADDDDDDDVGQNSYHPKKCPILSFFAVLFMSMLLHLKQIVANIVVVLVVCAHV